MAKRRRNIKQKTEDFDKKSWLVIIAFFVAGIGLIGFLSKEKIAYYYAVYFKSNKHHQLTNNYFETQRINKIVEHYAGKTFGADISHYQNRRDITWDSLYISHGHIPLDFIVLRATMGNNSEDNNYHYFLEKAKNQGIIVGAYHFYRPDEDPVLQAKSYLKVANLQKGDMLPVLDIEKLPKKKSLEQYLADVQTWLDIVEKHYGKKPIIYTYYYFYKDNLRGKFDEYPLWLANYNDVLTPSKEDKWSIWQFTENGITAGVRTKIDLNIYNGSKRDFKELLLD